MIISLFELLKYNIFAIDVMQYILIIFDYIHSGYIFGSMELHLHNVRQCQLSYFRPVADDSRVFRDRMRSSVLLHVC